MLRTRSPLWSVPVLLIATTAEAQFTPSEMVEAHNLVRSTLNAGGFAGQPVPSPPLPPMSWNPTLAATAQSYADGCPAGHNPSPEDPRRKNASCVGPGNPYGCCIGPGTGQCRAGENLFFSTAGTSASEVVQAFAGEVTDYTYAACCGAPNDFPKIGHYTQLVWASTTEVGCGIRLDCPSFFSTVVVCNYSVAGNIQTQFPYEIVVDTDHDGIADTLDDCKAVANTDQRDADHDGFGNACDADLNNDGIVNFVDLGRMKSAFFSRDPVADLSGDGVVNFSDLALMKKAFFKAPGPSGLGCAGQIPCPPLFAANP